MEFRNSGLPNNKVVEDAFNFIQAYQQEHRREVELALAQQVQQQYGQFFQKLEFNKQSGAITGAKYEMDKELLKQQFDSIIKDKVPLAAQQNIEQSLKPAFIDPALILLNNSENPSIELAVASMLAGCDRSPVDHKKIEEQFGPAIAGLVAEVSHIRAYPAETGTTLPTASADAKRILLAPTVAAAAALPPQLEIAVQRNPGKQIALPQNMEVKLFMGFAGLQGFDAKLDKLFVESFNQAMTTIKSPFHIDRDGKGQLTLIRDQVAAPNAPQIKPTPIDDEEPGL